VLDAALVSETFGWVLTQDELADDVRLWGNLASSAAAGASHFSARSSGARPTALLGRHHPGGHGAYRPH